MSLVAEVQKTRERFQRASKGSGVLNIIEFAEDKRIGLGLTLYPVQKFILKLFYKIPLTDDLSVDRIDIRDKYNEEIIGTFTEVEFFHYLSAQKQINMTYEDYLQLEDDFIEIDFFIGRRGTKTTTTSIIFSYTAYVLIKIKNPHKFFGISRSEPIGFTCVSNMEEGAMRQFDNLKQMLSTCKFFKPYIRGSNSKGYWLATPRFQELENSGIKMEAKGDLQFVGSAATGKVRGAANINVMLDEYAHFRDSGVVNKQEPLDVSIYKALTPSVAGFVDKNDKSYGKIFVATSPNGKRGDAYKKFNESFSDKSVLMLRMPSHWVNQRLSPQHLRKMYMESESAARQEYGGEFIEGTGNFIRNVAKLKAAINTSLQNSIKNAKRKGTYYMSVDLAQNGDGVGLAIGHKEKNRPTHTFVLEQDSDNKLELLIGYKDVVVIDYYVQLVPEAGGTIHNKVIRELVKKMYQYFNIAKTTIDQWGHQVFSELFAEDGLDIESFEILNATEDSNSIIAKNFNIVVGEGRAMFPGSFYEDGTFDEIKALVETVGRGGRIKVQAPSGGHDDRWSAISRVVYMVETLDGTGQELFASQGAVSYESKGDGHLTMASATQNSDINVELPNSNKNEVVLKKFEVKGK